MGYLFVKSVARFLLSLFYRRIDVVGSEHIPASGPVILAANHHNSVVDAMLLLATVPPQLVALANAPLFRHPLIGPFLRLMGAIPVHRRQEAGDDPRKNEAMFDAATAALAAGGAILIFPEGRTQPEPVLLPLRTGAARILLAAETAHGGRLGVTLLPVGLVFHEPGTFRTGWALVLVGKPVPTEDSILLHRTAPEAAVRQLTDRLTEALRQQIVEADDRETLRLLRVIEALGREEPSRSPQDEAARVAWMQQVMRAYRYLLSQEPDRVADLRQQVETYSDDLRLTGLTRRQVSQPYPPGLVLRYALREGLPLLLGLPLALLGVAIHTLPYRLTAAVVRRLGRTLEEEATDKIAAGLVLYPLCWIAEGGAAWWVGGGWALATFGMSLLPTGFFALAWRERLNRVGREARGFFQFLLNRDLRRRLLERQRAIMEELTALARLVPDSVWSGQTNEG